MSDDINWGDLYKEAGEDTPLAKGQYDVEVTNATSKISSAGNLMFQLSMKVITGSDAGRGLFGNIVMTKGNPNALRMFFKKLAAFGVGKETFEASPPPKPEAIARLLIGRKAKADVDIQTTGAYAGRNDIAMYHPLSGVAAPTAAAPQPAAPAPAPQPAAAPAPAPVAAPAPAPVAQPAPAPADTTPVQPGF